MRASFLVVLAVTGCAPRFTTVPDAEWRTVPAAERAKIDRAHEAEVARTQDELRLAAAAVTDARRMVAGHPLRHAIAPVAVASDDEWAAELQSYERGKTDALAQVAEASAEWQHATLQWREARVDSLTSQLTVLHCAREVERARAIDRSMLGTDTYDGAEFRGQLASVQGRWFGAEARVELAHAALERATANLSATKETYAELVRRGPIAPTSRDSALQLTAWTVTSRGHRLPLASRWHGSTADARYLTKPDRVAVRTRQ